MRSVQVFGKKATGWEVFTVSVLSFEGRAHEPLVNAYCVYSEYRIFL
jgi:hypothetical protein